MRIAQERLSDREVREATCEIMRKCWSWETEGYRITTQMTRDVLSKAAVENSSVEAVCGDLQGMVDSNTLRESLLRALDQYSLREHEAEMNAALAGTVPVQIGRRGVQIAIDWHDEPFYGKTPALLSATCRGMAKAGSTHFFRLASVYLIDKTARFTLGVTYVLPEDEMVSVVARLLDRVQVAGFEDTIAYLDKGFCTGPVLRLLQQRRQKAVLACPIRGKAGGTKALCKGRASYVTEYTFTDGTRVQAVMVATRVPDATGKRRRKWLLFVTVALNWSPQQVYQRYRRRFGIECSYRILRQCRASTSSRHPAFRFLLLGLALLLQNIWSRLRWCVARIPQPGPRQIDPAIFPFSTFKRFLLRAVEYVYSVPTILDVYFSPESVIY